MKVSGTVVAGCSCSCSTGFAGDICDRCDVGYDGYPSCGVLACNASESCSQPLELCRRGPCSRLHLSVPCRLRWCQRATRANRATTDTQPVSQFRALSLMTATGMRQLSSAMPLRGAPAHVALDSAGQRAALATRATWGSPNCTPGFVHDRISLQRSCRKCVGARCHWMQLHVCCSVRWPTMRSLCPPLRPLSNLRSCCMLRRIGLLHPCQQREWGRWLVAAAVPAKRVTPALDVMRAKASMVATRTALQRPASTIRAAGHASGVNGTMPNCSCACLKGYCGSACSECSALYVGYPNCTLGSCLVDEHCNSHAATVSGAPPSCNCTCREGYFGARCDKCASGYTNYPTCQRDCTPERLCSGHA